MPYADNLYSADDSDADSFSDELAPTDGYFEQRNHPQNLMVPNPPSDENENESSAESKAKEARAETPSDSQDITSYRAASPHLQPSQPSLPKASPSPSTVPAPSSTSSSSPKIRHPKPQPRTPSIPTSSPLSYSHNSSRQQSFSEDPDPEPLRAYDQPPPAYSPPLSETSVNEPANYNTISTLHQLEEGRSPYQRDREPESMGSPRDTNDESTPLFGRAENRAPHRLSRRRLFLLLAFLGLAVISTVIGVTSSRSKSSNQKNGTAPGGTPHKTPKNEKGGDQSSPIFDRPIVSNGPYCSLATYHVDASPAQYALGPDNAMRVYQTFDNQDGSHGGHHVETVGEVHIRKAPDGTKDAYITTDFYVSDRSLEQYIAQEREDGYLVVKTLQYRPVSNPVQSCISIEITVWLPDYTQIANLDIGATTLNVRVFDDVKAYVSNVSTLGTVSGSIAFPGDKPDTGHRSSVESRGLHLPKLPKLPSLVDLIPKLPEYFEHPSTPNIPSRPSAPERSKNTESSPEPSPKTFSSRDTRVETISGPISGTFPQYDSLYLSSSSGDINVYVEPHEVLKSDPKPALLDLHTISGQVHAKYELRKGGKLPLRNYQTDVDTKSGTITGDFIIGSKLYVKTLSGTIKVSALPFGILDEDHSDFITFTASGSTEVVVLDPITSTAAGVDNDDPYNIIARSSYKTLRSQHGSTSGHIHVRLPQAFEGQIEGKTVSGGIRIVGDGVRIIRDDSRDWGSRKVVAVKGEGDVTNYGNVQVDDISGSLDVEVGKVL